MADSLCARLTVYLHSGFLNTFQSQHVVYFSPSVSFLSGTLSLLYTLYISSLALQFLSFQYASLHFVSQSVFLSSSLTVWPLTGLRSHVFVSMWSTTGLLSEPNILTTVAVCSVAQVMVIILSMNPRFGVSHPGPFLVLGSGLCYEGHLA